MEYNMIVPLPGIEWDEKLYMAIIKSTVKVGTKLPKDIIKQIKQAAKYPITYIEDCPKSTPEALKEFAHLATERDRHKKTVTQE